MDRIRYAHNDNKVELRTADDSLDYYTLCCVEHFYSCGASIDRIRKI